MKKTNGMRLLDKERIDYSILTYPTSDNNIDGISVANKVNRDLNLVFKTLVARSSSNFIFVFLIPVHKELDFKKAQAITGEKKIELIDPKDLLKYTGYIRGGCSPLGMKKMYPTFIDSSALNYEKIVFSGGKIGLQIEMHPKDLKIIKGEFKDLIKS